MNKITIYKKSIFSKIKNFFFTFFNKKTLEQNNNSQPDDSKPQDSSFQQLSTKKQNDSKHFLDSIVIKDKEKFRILTLKEKYDRHEITFKDIPLSDLGLLIQAYNEETLKLKQDTQKILKDAQTHLNQNGQNNS